MYYYTIHGCSWPQLELLSVQPLMAKIGKWDTQTEIHFFVRPCSKENAWLPNERP
jgi:hypothetical protein